ncbi:MAG: hypothetical protein OXI01_06060 [Albidovulum sp.]|nr:hypothetical protein [Albidovulum sp.]
MKPVRSTCQSSTAHLEGPEELNRATGRDLLERVGPGRDPTGQVRADLGDGAADLVNSKIDSKDFTELSSYSFDLVATDYFLSFRLDWKATEFM